MSQEKFGQELKPLLISATVEVFAALLSGFSIMEHYLLAGEACRDYNFMFHQCQLHSIVSLMSQYFTFQAKYIARKRTYIQIVRIAIFGKVNAS